MENPTVTLKLGEKEIFKIDLWQLAIWSLQGNKQEALSSWNSFKLFLDDQEVLRDKGEVKKADVKKCKVPRQR